MSYGHKPALNLGEHWEVFIKMKFPPGRYGSASEVVRDALRAMEERKNKTRSPPPHLSEGATQTKRMASFLMTSQWIR